MFLPDEYRLRQYPKQAEIDWLLNHSKAEWIGLGGSRGSGKSQTLDDCTLTTAAEHPGCECAMVMRNDDQTRKYHIEPIVRRFPELEQYLNKSERNLKIPAGEDGRISRIDFTYAQNLNDVERRFRSANYRLIVVDQAEQFLPDELVEMKKGCRSGDGMAKMLLGFNMGGAGIQGLRKWFHTREYNERQDPANYEFVHIFTWDNVYWALQALAEDGLTEEDYFSWTDEQRMFYCATRTSYGRELDSQDDALRNRDWFASWESLEGAYFGRVFDLESLRVDRHQVARLIKRWDRLWLSQDWGKSHYCATHWHAQTLLAPEDVLRILGWQVSKPLKAVITFRELIVSEMSSPDVGRKIVEKTPEAERRQIQRFFLSPDAFGDRDSEHTTAENLGDELVKAGLPRPEHADNDRKGGWQLMYDLLEETKRHASVDDEIWLISSECPELLNALPMLIRNPKDLDDVLKTDVSQARIEQDAADSARYGLKSMLEPRKTKPLEVRAQEEYAKYTDPTSRAIRMIEFELKNRQASALRRPRGR